MRNLLIALLISSCFGCATAVNHEKVAIFGDNITRNQDTIKEKRMTVAQVKHVLRLANEELGEDKLYKAISKEKVVANG